MNSCCIWGFSCVQSNPVMSLGICRKARSYDLKRTFKSRWSYCVVSTSTGTRSSPSSGPCASVRSAEQETVWITGRQWQPRQIVLTHCALPSCARVSRRRVCVDVGMPRRCMETDQEAGNWSQELWLCILHDTADFPSFNSFPNLGPACLLVFVF